MPSYGRKESSATDRAVQEDSVPAHRRHQEDEREEYWSALGADRSLSVWVFKHAERMCQGSVGEPRHSRSRGT